MLKLVFMPVTTALKVLTYEMNYIETIQCSSRTHWARLIGENPFTHKTHPKTLYKVNVLLSTASQGSELSVGSFHVAPSDLRRNHSVMDTSSCFPLRFPENRYSMRMTASASVHRVSIETFTLKVSIRHPTSETLLTT